jgi:hypothetical protein
MIALVGLLMAGGAVAADKIPRLKVSETVDIAAPPAKIWAIIKDYDNMSWHPAIKKDDATDGNIPGSVRTLDLGGPKLTETLTRYDATKMSYSYKINPDPDNLKAVPVTDYRARIQVKSGPNHGSTVIWRASFHRGDPSANPAPDMNDETATKAITGIFRAGLDNLKKTAESGT